MGALCAFPVFDLKLLKVIIVISFLVHAKSSQGIDEGVSLKRVSDIGSYNFRRQASKEDTMGFSLFRPSLTMKGLK